MTNSSSHIICDDRIIIDNIFLFPNHVSTILHYFSCVARVFIKYKLSFILALNKLVTISLFVITVPLYRSSIYCKASHFHSTEYRVYPASVCVASIIDIAPDLKPTSNHCEKCSDFIIVTTSLS